MSFPPSNYIRNQNSVRRWDNILNNLRKEIAHLRKLTLKGLKGTLKASNTGLVGGTGTDGNDIFSMGGFLTLSRIFLNFNINYNYSSSEEIMPVDNWALDYGNGGDVLTGGHHFVVPNFINGESTANSKLFVQVIFKANFELVYDFDSTNLTFYLVKNDNIIIATHKYAEYSLSSNVIFHGLCADINDIVICDPGDTLDFYITNNGESKINIFGSTSDTYALFSVVRVISTSDL